MAECFIRSEIPDGMLLPSELSKRLREIFYSKLIYIESLMENDYKEAVTFDEQLNKLLSPIFDPLEALSYEQIEKIVFYLKSIHNYNGKCGRTWSNHIAFEEKLGRLRNSNQQLTLMRLSKKILIKSMLLHMSNGVVFVLGVFSLFLLDWYWSVSIFTFFAYILHKADKKMLSVLNINKEQDRRYFLSSIRLAENCTELEWCGFFAFYDGFQVGFFDEAQSKTHYRNVDVISRNLRNALYNDELASR